MPNENMKFHLSELDGKIRTRGGKVIWSSIRNPETEFVIWEFSSEKEAVEFLEWNGAVKNDKKNAERRKDEQDKWYFEISEFMTVNNISDKLKKGRIK